MHDPRLMLGMDRAVERIRAAVRAGEPMLIYGDYDVDGTTATVLLKTAIERLGTADQPAKVTYHVPHRLREGYGMQVGRLQTAAETGVRLVLSVDTGIRAFRAAEEAKRLGLDLIVTDHHLPDKELPPALATLRSECASSRDRCSRAGGHCSKWQDCLGIARPRRPKLDFGWDLGSMRRGGWTWRQTWWNYS